METMPRSAYGIRTVDIQHDAAGVTLMGEITRLSLEDDGIPDFEGNALRVRECSRQCTSGGGDAQGCEEFLASIFGDDPRGKVDLERLRTINRLFAAASAVERRQMSERAKCALGRGNQGRAQRAQLFDVRASDRRSLVHWSEDDRLVRAHGANRIEQMRKLEVTRRLVGKDDGQYDASESFIVEKDRNRL